MLVKAFSPQTSIRSVSVFPCIMRATGEICQMISSWDIKTLIIYTNGATETRQLPVCVGFGWHIETSFIYPSLTLRSSELKSAVTLAVYSDQNIDLWGLPNTNNCVRSISSERFCNMLTLAWRLFPVKPVLHRHCSCSQNWRHSPERLQKSRGQA